MFAAIGTNLAPDHGCFKAINCQLEKPPLPCCDKAREEGSIRSIKEEEEADDGLLPFNLGSPVGEAFTLNSVDVEERVDVPKDEEEEEEERETADAVAATAAAATYSSTSCTSAKWLGERCE